MSTHAHSHRASRTNARPNGDPTNTTGIRESYAAEAYNRFRRLKGLVRTTVEENDALRLGDRSRRGRFNARPQDDFRFTTRAEKEAAFLEWFRNALDDEVLKPVGSRTVRRGGHWTAAYVRSASRRGIKNANQRLKRQGHSIDVGVGNVDATFNAPVHQDLLRSLYLRNYRALKGVTDAVDKEISRVLTEGVAQGKNPREMASTLNERIDDVGITRARVLARTETVRAANEQALTRYEQAGVDEVGVEVEWLTAQDDRVCPVCASKAGNRYSVEEAHGILPQHPQCRCTFVPIV